MLVSIQALIFCSYEPESYRKLIIDPRSYDKTLIQLWTVRYAMLDWLQNNEMRQGLWRDVVKTYFERNCGTVLRVVNRWAGANKYISEREERELATALQEFKQNRH